MQKLSLDIMIIDNASVETRGGSGKATEFGRPQGKKPGSK